MIGDCSFCWYCWNCLPLLFKLSFHNYVILALNFTVKLFSSSLMKCIWLRNDNVNIKTNAARFLCVYIQEQVNKISKLAVHFLYTFKTECFLLTSYSILYSKSSVFNYFNQFFKLWDIYIKSIFKQMFMGFSGKTIDDIRLSCRMINHNNMFVNIWIQFS